MTHSLATKPNVENKQEKMAGKDVGSSLKNKGLINSFYENTELIRNWKPQSEKLLISKLLLDRQRKWSYWLIKDAQNENSI
jgi:hypothetical protein